MDKSVEAGFCAAFVDEVKAARVDALTVDRPRFRNMLTAFLEAEAERLAALPIQDATINGGLLYCRSRAAELRGKK